MREVTSLAVVAGVVLAAILSVHGQAPAGGQGRGAAPPPPPMEIKQVKPGLYMVTGFGGNSTVRVTNDGVILVDTKNLGQPVYEDLVAKIRSVTDKPVKYVFITHVHQDHAGNIGRFVQAGAQVITFEGPKKNLETGGLDGKGYTSPAGKPDSPNVTYSGKSREVKLGGVRAIAYHFASAHTSGDSVVYFPDLKVLATGDEFVAQPPNADIPNGGSVVTFPKALREALKLDFDTAIPGHGNDAMTRADMQAYAKKWDAIAKKALELRKAGVSKEEIRQRIQAEVPEMAPWMMTGIVNDMRLDGFYAELTNATK